MYRGAFAIVDLVAIRSNVRQIKSLLGSQTRLLVAVKANAYGHGAVQVARAALAAGATDLGVASLEEAIELRAAGILAPILVLGVVAPEAARVAAMHDVNLTLSPDWGFVERMARDGSLRPDSFARFLGITDADHPLGLHLKLDTGMSRIGFQSEDDVLWWARFLKDCENVQVNGLFTHLAKADAADLSFANKQIDRLREVERLLEEEHLRPPIVHAANSAAAMLGPEYHFDMVRLGISAYGYPPNPEFKAPVSLTPALHLYGFLTRIATISAGETVGYGGTFTATRETRVGTLPVGYGDGYPRWLSNRGYVVIHGKKASVLGRVCMDQVMVDVTDIPDARVGDCACLYGRYAPPSWTAAALWGKRPDSNGTTSDMTISDDTVDNGDMNEWLVRTFEQHANGREWLSLDTLAAIGETISYEMMCQLSARIPRLYAGDTESL